jgi:hypothetical protein
MQRFQSRRDNQQGGQNGAPRDSAAMKRMMKMRNNQQGGVRDTSARQRRRQSGQQGTGQKSQVATPASVNK